MTQNQIAYWNLQESKRHNEANEGLTKRGQDIERFKHETKDEHYQRQDAETKRANLAKEAELNRSNLADESETRRSNKARENETYRHNRISELLGVSGQAVDTFGHLAKMTQSRGISTGGSGTVQQSFPSMPNEY